MENSLDSLVRLQTNFGIEAACSDIANSDLGLNCGPRFNTFAKIDRRDEPGKFFELGIWKAMVKTSLHENDAEQWDGMA